MRKISLLLTCVLLAGLLTGCGIGGNASSSGTPASEEKPLHLKELNVELTRTDDNLEALQGALKTLPAALKSALAEHGVKVDESRVTVGSSAAATCQALKDGGVDLAFLPADSFAAVDGGEAILAAAARGPKVRGTVPADWNGKYGSKAAADVGNRSLICTAASEYGKNLAERVSEGGELTWDELDHARWGILNSDSQTGYQCAELWLEDHYQGMGLSDLSDVKTYLSEKELVSAAAAGEIDVFPLRADIRSDYAAQWPEIQTQARVLGVSGKLYTWVAAASGSLAKSTRFQKALEEAVGTLQGDGGQMLLIFGEDPYTAVKNSALDGMRRIQPRGE